MAFGTASTYNVSTSATDLKEVWRKVQAGIMVAFQFGVEEWQWLRKLKDFKVDWSAREITMELDINDDVGTAMIPEGGYEARPSSPTAVTATLTWVQANKRFTISKIAQYIQEQQGTRGQLESQLRWQSKKAVDGIRRKFGDMFYGFSTGTCAIAGTYSSGDDITLTNMYGVTSLGGTSANRKVNDLFRVGDYIAALNPSGPALRTSGIQAISAINTSTNVITCAASSISSLTTADLITFGNNLENATLTGGTERSKHLVGLLDGVTSASVHSVSNGTYPRWAPAVNNSAGGRFTTVKYQTLKDAIYNLGGGDMDMIIWSNGVKRDVVSQLTAGLRFTDAFALELDGKAGSKGVSFNTSRRVPDGYVWGLDSSNSVNKMDLLPEPGKQAFSDGEKLQDNNGLVFSIDFPAAMVWTNRANVGMYSGLTES